MFSRKTLSNWLRLIVTLLALVWLALTFDIGAVLDEAQNAVLAWLLVAFGLAQLGMVIRALRWQRLLKGLEVEVGLGRLVSLYYTGQFYSILLPSGFAGDVVRVLDFGAGYKRDLIAGSVLLDRASGLTAMLGIGLFTLPFGGHLLDDAALLAASIVCGGGFTAGMLLLDGRVPRMVLGFLPQDRLVGIQQTLRNMLGVEQASRRSVWEAFGISIVYSFSVVVLHFVVGNAYQADVPLSGFGLVVPLFSVAQLMPSIQGIGFTEGIYTAMLTSATVTQETLIAISLTVHATNILTGALGGVQYIITALRGLIRA